MIVIVRQSEQSTDRRRDYWNWCFAHGFLATEVADEVVADTEAGTLTVRRFLPVSQPGDPDFPELRRDEFNQPLAETVVLPLGGPLPGWLVTSRPERLAA